MAKVFISYSKRDYIGDGGKVIQDNVVDKVIKSLSEHGIDFWIDREKLEPGETFASTIANSISECDFFLFLSSRNSNSSPWTLREISMAIDSGKAVLPVRLDDSEYARPVALYLASIQYVDWQELGEQEALKRIINRIQGVNLKRRLGVKSDSLAAPRVFKSIDPTIKNASIVLAGGVSILYVIGRIFSPFSGLIPVRGFWLVTLLAVPLWCFWFGMLIRSRIGKPREWLLVVIGLLLAIGFWLLYDWRHTVNGPGINGMCHKYILMILLGFVFPWERFRKNSDRTGWRSAIICIITAISYAALYLVWQRLGNKMTPEFADMEKLLLVVTTNVLPLAMIPPLISAAEFAFSKAGQWLGSSKWFLWLAIPTSLYCFCGAWLSRPFYFSLDLSWESARWICILVQPVTVYLMIVLWRVFAKLFSGTSKNSSHSTWKDVFRL